MIKKIIAYLVVTLVVIVAGIALFSIFGVAAFLLPLLAGAFK